MSAADWFVLPYFWLESHQTFRPISQDVFGTLGKIWVCSSSLQTSSKFGAFDFFLFCVFRWNHQTFRGRQLIFISHLPLFCPHPYDPKGIYDFMSGIIWDIRLASLQIGILIPTIFVLESKWLSCLISDTPLKFEDVDTCWRESLSTWLSALRILMLPSIWKYERDAWQRESLPLWFVISPCVSKGT